MLHTREVMLSAITEALSNVFEKGKDLHGAFTGVHSSCRYGPWRISNWTVSSSLKSRESHYLCMTKERSDPVKNLKFCTLRLSQNSRLLMMLRWMCWMAQLWFMRSDQQMALTFHAFRYQLTLSSSISRLDVRWDNLKSADSSKTRYP